MSQPDLPPLTPELYGDRPAREPHVKMVDRWVELSRFPFDHPEHELEFLHRQLNEEANVLENAASSLVDFPDADWELRMYLARQCSDEARHVLAYRRLYESRGGKIGQYPVLDFQYRALQRIDSLIGRLAVQNRTFEAEGLDAVTHAVDQARERGDEASARMYDSQQADEILHVGFANDWIRRLVAADPRNILRMSSALTQGARAFQETFAGGGTDVIAYGVAVQERREAGFDDGEIDVATQQSAERRHAGAARLGVPSPTKGNG